MEFMNDNNLFEGDLPKLLRPSIQDIWNAEIVRGATFSSHDIPNCPTYLPNGLPKKLISYQDAKTIYYRNIRKGLTTFHVDAFVDFYCDDQIFDGKRSSIWKYPKKALEILKHFDGAITPDFSTYADFPDPIKRYNTYRMRALGWYFYINKVPVINNVRWGTSETWEYSFDGIDTESVVCIGTVGSGLRCLENRFLFEIGFQEMIKILRPKIILVRGSVNYDVFKQAEKDGIEIIPFDSETCISFRKRGEVI